MRAKILDKNNLPEKVPVGRANNLIGKTFGRLVVLYRTNPPEHIKNKTQTYWLCKCQCGNYIQVRTGALVTNGVQSCGCLHSETASKIMKNLIINNNYIPWNKKDLTGYKFGKLTALENYSYKQRSYWKCCCECGNFRDVETYNLIHQKIFDCGCGNLSNGEYKIKTFLDFNNIPYKKEFTFSDLFDKQLLRFDFAIFDTKNNLECLIEYQGEQHFSINNPWWSETLEKHDKMKQKYCYNHNIKLIEIMYYEDVEQVLTNNLLR